MKEIYLQVHYTEFESTSTLPATDQQLVQAARQAASQAYAPYSGFKVGAAVLLGNGVVVTGNNQENAAYPSGLCAERTALFYASAQYPGIPVVAIAVSTLTRSAAGIAKPCGGCRQVMAEYEDLAGQPLHILLDSEEKIIVMDGIEQLLPLCFRKRDLQ